jgi:hypothetical protein
MTAGSPSYLKTRIADAQVAKVVRAADEIGYRRFGAAPAYANAHGSAKGCAPAACRASCIW